MCLVAWHKSVEHKSTTYNAVRLHSYAKISRLQIFCEFFSVGQAELGLSADHWNYL